MSDTVAKLGKLIEGDEQRDAIHIAVAPVIAAEMLIPCQHVGLTPSGMAASSEKHIGIVDPFLTERVYKGDKFWLYLYPGSITSLLHHWTHPAFGANGGGVSKEHSERWLRDFIERSDCPDYDTVIDAAVNGDGNKWSDEYLHFNGRDAHGEIPDEFWDHVENLTGKKVPKRAKYFSCSC